MNFVRLSNGTIINLDHVVAIDGDQTQRTLYFNGKCFIPDGTFGSMSTELVLDETDSQIINAIINAKIWEQY